MLSFVIVYKKCLVSSIYNNLIVSSIKPMYFKCMLHVAIASETIKIKEKDLQSLNRERA